jgi:ribose transport system substrate-binding protein
MQHSKGLISRSLAFIGLSLLVSGGCHRPDSTTIAFIPQTTGIDIWESAHEAAKGEGDKYGFTIYWNAPAREDDAQQQVALVSAVLQRPLKGLILAPDHYLALLSVLRTATDRHVPVAVINTRVPLDPSSDLGLFVNDEQEMGQELAERASLAVGDHGELAIIGMAPNTDHLYRRLKAIQETLSRKHPSVHVVAIRNGTGNIAEDQQIVYALAHDHPHIGALIALDGSSLRAAWSERRVGNLSDNVRLIGCDRQRDVMRGIRLGEIDSTVVEDTGEMAKEAVRFIAQSGSNGHHDVLREVEPILITRENIDSSSIQAFLSMDRANP